MALICIGLMYMSCKILTHVVNHCVLSCVQGYINVHKTTLK